MDFVDDPACGFVCSACPNGTAADAAVKALGRQLLVALVIPPLVFRPDGRGLHDLFAGTSTVTFATLRTLVK